MFYNPVAASDTDTSIIKCYKCRTSADITQINKLIRYMEILLFFLNFRFSIIYVFLATALYDLCKQNIQFIEKN